MKNLHDLPRFCDRWSHLYLERGILDQEASGLVLHSLPDISEVLDVAHDSGEIAEEMEGRAVTLALGNSPGDLPGESKSEGAG